MTRAPAARAPVSRPDGIAAPPSRIAANADRPAPASSIRRSCAGTRDTYPQPNAARFRCEGSSRSTTTGAVPLTRDRTSTPRPAMWLVGSGHSQRPPGRAPIRSRLARAEASSASAPSCTPLGSPVEPEVAITTAVPSGRSAPVPGAAGRESSGRHRISASSVSTVAGVKACSRSVTRADGRPGSRGRIAGPLPSSAAASASSRRPAPAAGGSSRACNGRPAINVRLTGKNSSGIGGVRRDRVAAAGTWHGPGLHRCRVRDPGRHREDHHQPARGAQRVPPHHTVRAFTRVQRRPRRPGHRGDHLDRGGGHVLHVCCDLTIAADNAVFGQTGPKVGSFDGGYGSWLLAATVGLKKAREIWYLCRQYSAQEALDMGLVNTVVPLERLEEETILWAREMLDKSPLALRMLKGALNTVTDGAAGMQQFAGDATLLYYMSEEAQEGRDAYVAKRAPDFGKFPRRP